jgi:antitoxin HicB
MRSKKTASPAPRTLGDYLALSYRYELIREEEGFVALHPDLLGCLAQGDTAEEAIQNLDAARRVWLEVRYEDNLPIPEPLSLEDFSGKVLLRIPPTLHAQLARLAQEQGASLNQMINNILSEHLGESHGESALAAKVLRAIEQLGKKRPAMAPLDMLSRPKAN